MKYSIDGMQNVGYLFEVDANSPEDARRIIHNLGNLISDAIDMCDMADTLPYYVHIQSISTPEHIRVTSIDECGKEK